MSVNDDDNQDLIDMLDSMLPPPPPDRSRIPTGDWIRAETTSVINRLDDSIEAPEIMDSHLVQHQEICLARGGSLAEHLFYYPGVDVGCHHCSYKIRDYLFHYPEDRAPYEDDDGHLDWELIQSELDTGDGVVSYTFYTDRSESLTCDNCRDRFRVVDERDALYHANAGGATIPTIRTGTRDSEDLHGHLCGPCMEWFKSSLQKGRIG